MTILLTVHPYGVPLNLLFCFTRPLMMNSSGQGKHHDVSASISHIDRCTERHQLGHGISDCRLLRQKALDALFHNVSAEGAVFFLPDGNGSYTYVMLKNLEKRYSDYYHTYFHQMDPLQLTRRIDNRQNGPIPLEETVNYDAIQSTEYYSDFLKPQEIHYKLVVNLVAEKELHGRIVLTRPRKFRGFNERDLGIAKSVSPYLAHALAHHDLRREVTRKGNLLKYVEEHSSVGMVLLDEELHVIHKNRKAEEIFRQLRNPSTANWDDDPILDRLLKDCREMKASLNEHPAGGMVVPKQRTVKGPNHTLFSVRSKALEREAGWEDTRLFMVCIEKLSPFGGVNIRYLMEMFQLSKRETDVVSLVFSGLKNGQIAKKLFISEITVKKHLQNIYAKVGVNSRTSLINRILTR